MKTPQRTPRFNEFGQPIGFDLPGWEAPPFPPQVALQGRYCRLEPLKAALHARDIYEAQREDTDGARWTYLFHGPYDNYRRLREVGGGRGSVTRSAVLRHRRRGDRSCAWGPAPTCASSRNTA